MNSENLRVLFATPECAPWVKTGGLGDVSAALPAALEASGLDVRVLLPAHRPVYAATAASGRRELATLRPTASRPRGCSRRRCRTACRHGWYARTLYARNGGPYQDSEGSDWPDNALRFGLSPRRRPLAAK